jgi:hypothetical protein
LGPSFQAQQAKAQELEAKSSSSSAGAYPANYFLDETYTRLFNEGPGEKASDSTAAPQQHQQQQQSHSEQSQRPDKRRGSREGDDNNNEYRLGNSADNHSDDEDENNNNGSNNNRGGSRDVGDGAGGALSRRDRDSKDGDHRLNAPASNGTNATGRLHEHIKGSAAAAPKAAGNNSASGRSHEYEDHDDGDDDDDLVSEELASQQPSQRQRNRSQRAHRQQQERYDADSKPTGNPAIYGYESETDHHRIVHDDERAIHELEKPLDIDGGSGSGVVNINPNKQKSPVVKKKKKAMPTDDAPAVVRRAADTWNEDSDEEDSRDAKQSGSGKQPRASIDAMLNSTSRDSGDAKGGHYSDGEEDDYIKNLKVTTVFVKCYVDNR